MDATALQAEINALLVRRGLRDEAGKVGLECVATGLRRQLGINSLAICSIALGKVKPYTEWFSLPELFSILCDRGVQARPKLSGWDDRGFPFVFGDTKQVARKGTKPTLERLEEAFEKIADNLDWVLRDLKCESITLASRCALLDLYSGMGDKLIVREESGYTNPEAVRWIAAGIRGELITYAFSDPFRYSTLVRKNKQPLLTLSEARELNSVSLPRISALYPLKDLAR